MEQEEFEKELKEILHQELDKIPKETIYEKLVDLSRENKILHQTLKGMQIEQDYLLEKKKNLEKYKSAWKLAKEEISKLNSGFDSYNIILNLESLYYIRTE